MKFLVSRIFCIKQEKKKTLDLKLTPDCMIKL